MTDRPTVHEQVFGMPVEGFVDLARKDLGVAREVADGVGVDAAFTDAVAAAMPAAYLTEG